MVTEWEKLDALGAVVRLAANLPPEVARGYATNFYYWCQHALFYGLEDAHRSTSEGMSIPDLCADARAKIDAAYALLFT